ncbi:hypothetical protein [Thermoflavimicrobium dichotomicum]|nr:hypothetical protein [Thermoflavimicrobium dichotomicum]
MDRQSLILYLSFSLTFDESSLVIGRMQDLSIDSDEANEKGSIGAGSRK